MTHTGTNDVQWLAVLHETVRSYRRMIDRTVEQLSDDELFAHPSPGINSVAIILRHLGGNLRSRWADFLTTDGEKPDRNRDAEFQDWQGDRESLLAYFDAGWTALESAFELIGQENVGQSILIRGEPHTLQEALSRSITHVTYHVGQITMVSRMVHQGDWQWLTIAPGQSSEFNRETWGTPAGRSVLSKPKEV